VARLIAHISKVIVDTPSLNEETFGIRHKIIHERIKPDSNHLSNNDFLQQPQSG
jgi:hypothetical protein